MCFAAIHLPSASLCCSWLDAGGFFLFIALSSLLSLPFWFFPWDCFPCKQGWPAFVTAKRNKAILQCCLKTKKRSLRYRNKKPHGIDHESQKLEAPPSINNVDHSSLHVREDTLKASDTVLYWTVHVFLFITCVKFYRHALPFRVIVPFLTRRWTFPHFFLPVYFSLIFAFLAVFVILLGMSHVNPGVACIRKT